MRDERILLFIRFREVPPAIERPWNEWLDTVHVPSRLEQPGFLGAKRFRATGGDYRYLTMYELANFEAFGSESYLALRADERKRGPESFEAITPTLPGFERGVYRAVGPQNAASLIPRTPTSLVVAHDVPLGRDDEFNAWYDTEHMAAVLRSVPGVRSARRFQRIETDLPANSGVHTPYPRYVAIFELDDEKAPASDAFKKAIQSPWSDWVRTWYIPRFCVVAHAI